ncbi:hypothetical protein ACMG4M_11520 [Alcanivorax sp. IL3]|uniref:hypothetical protein n=1 Tax=unclassified Alcanivorax TaxID=2638842 RepID=UPI0039C192CB
MSTLYLHVGYPKTATTTLQKWVFPDLPDIKYVGRTYYDKGRSSDESTIMSATRLVAYRENPEITKNGADILRNQSHDCDVMISLEGVLAQCLVPTANLKFGGKITIAPTAKEALEHAIKFAELSGFDDVKVIVTLREQGDLLSSFFAEGYMDRYSRIPKISTFEKFTDDLLIHNQCVDSSVVNYQDLENVLIELLGEQNYVFLGFDWLKKDPEKFSKVLGEFLGTDYSVILERIGAASPENVRRAVKTKTSLKMRRKNARYFLDRIKKIFLPNVNLGIGRFLGLWLSKIEYGPKDFEPDAHDIERIREFYKASNQKFAERNPEFISLIENR